MEPQLIEKGPIRLAGVVSRGTPEELDFGSLWNAEFNKHVPAIRPYSVDKAYYGAWFNTQEGWLTPGEANQMEYMVAMAVDDDLPTVPEYLEVREIPAATYAVFACKVGTIGATYGQVLLNWLPTSGFAYDHAAADFEYYPRSAKTQSSPAYIYIPIKQR